MRDAMGTTWGPRRLDRVSQERTPARHVAGQHAAMVTQSADLDPAPPRHSMGRQNESSPT